MNRTSNRAFFLVLLVCFAAGCSRAPMGADADAGPGGTLDMGSISGTGGAGGAAKNPADSLQGPLDTLKDAADAKSDPALQKGIDALTGLAGGYDQLWTATQTQGTSDEVAAMRTIYGVLQLFPGVVSALRAAYPGLAEALADFSDRWPVWQFVNPNNGARAYASPHSYADATSGIRSMATFGFRLEGLVFYVPKAPSTSCSASLYEWIYYNPAIGDVYPYLTEQSAGERAAGEPPEFRASWGTVGVLCQADPGGGAAPLVRFHTQNGQLPHRPFIGVSTADAASIDNLTRQKWNRDRTLGWVYPR